MTTDVTDSTFEEEVLARSEEAPVVVDLWAPWCGPCRTLGPILERVVEATSGKASLAKVNVDENPRVAAAFNVQSIPAVFAVKGRKVVDSFVGALPEGPVIEWVDRLLDVPSEADLLVAAGDEASLRKALELDNDHPGAIVGLAELLVASDRPDEALAVLGRVPETGEARRVAALARLSSARLSSEGLSSNGLSSDELSSNPSGNGEAIGLEKRLEGLLETVRGDDSARQEFLDLLETLPPDDPRRASYRRALTSRLF